MMDALEGYADGLAGAGMQDRPIMPLGRESYESGFFAGSLDRKTMLAPDAFHRWADGLMNSTAGDVMQTFVVKGNQSIRLHGDGVMDDTAAVQLLMDGGKLQPVESVDYVGA